MCKFLCFYPYKNKHFDLVNSQEKHKLKILVQIYGQYMVLAMENINIQNMKLIVIWFAVKQYFIWRRKTENRSRKTID